MNGSCKHSSLLRYGNNYGSKKFYSPGPWTQSYKTFYRRDLRIFKLTTVFVRLDWKKLTNDKHSSLLRKSVIYGQKSFITLSPGPYVIKLFYGRDLRILVIS